MKFGVLIRIRRQEAELTQAQLGALIGVHRTTIISWETSKAMPKDAKTWQRIEEVLGIDLAEAMEEDNVLADYVMATQNEAVVLSKTLDFQRLRDDLMRQSRFQLRSWQAILEILAQTGAISLPMLREVQETQEKIGEILRMRKKLQRKKAKMARKFKK